MTERSLVTELEARVRARPLPRHVAIIMDGNGRWAEFRDLPRVAGHREGAEAVRAVTRAARRIGLEALTLYAFSSENWGRPEPEVGALMHLLAEFLESERGEMMANGIRLNAIGDLERLPTVVREKLASVRAETAGNQRDDPHARPLLRRPAGARAGGPPGGGARRDPPWRPRTWRRGSGPPGCRSSTSSSGRAASGGSPTSSSWQCAYAELVFTEVLWPDFRDLELLSCLAEYQARERRFGMTGAQLAGHRE